jgi:hypothetical protein
VIGLQIVESGRDVNRQRGLRASSGRRRCHGCFGADGIDNTDADASTAPNTQPGGRTSSLEGSASPLAMIEYQRSSSMTVPRIGSSRIGHRW